MSFASPLFLWYFMPAVLAAVLIAPRGWRNGVVATASLAFYAVAAGPTTLLLLGCMVVNCLIGPALEPDDWDLEPQRRRRWLGGVVAFNVAVLAVWKYAGFASAQAAGLAAFTGLDLPIVELALPIGVSFYTFHHISYV
ncbi:MAG: MBOAT family protein, partial [Actinomycetota bacterium]|nr:MBOAT family protein [Actinomycetota bacterium]